MERGIFGLPLPQRAGTKLSIIQYADDTILVMQACPRQLIALKGLLNSFAESIGLRVNYSKSAILPISVDADKIEILGNTLNCQIGSMPFTYLGLPMGLKRPGVAECLPFVERIERRLTGCAQFLTQGGKLEMVNLVLSSLSIYYLSIIKVPHTVITQVDKYRRHGLWRGSDLNAKKPPLAAWHMVTRPKLEGGLGVVNLRTKNDALRMKFLHKFYNKVELPWVQLVWDNY